MSRLTSKKNRVVRPSPASTQLGVMNLEDRVVPTLGLLQGLKGAILEKLAHVSHIDLPAKQGHFSDLVSQIKGKSGSHADKGDKGHTDDGTADLFDPAPGDQTDVLVADGTYTLHNHPAFGHGLQLNNLIVPNENTATTYQFDFDHPDSDITLVVDGDIITISGTMFGGRILDGTTDQYDPNDSGLWEVDFEYTNVQQAFDDDDLEVPAIDGGPFGFGTLTQLYGPEKVFDLRGDSGDMTFEFRLGDEADNSGYEGFEGVSGWGWLQHRLTGEGDFIKAGGSDWNFIAKLVEDEPPVNGGGQGLTPGFWRQPHHFECWTGVKPTDSFESVFGVDSPSFGKKFTLLDAVTAKGGGEFAMLRHAVAAYLNAASEGVNYKYTTAEVVMMVQQAYMTGNFEAVKNKFETQNELGNVDLKGDKKSKDSDQDKKKSKKEKSSGKSKFNIKDAFFAKLKSKRKC